MENNDRLSVAVVIKSFTTNGGAEKFAVEIAKRMLARNHIVDIFAREIDLNAAHGMNIHRVAKEMSFSSALSLYKFATASSMLLNGSGCDVIHSHEKGVLCDVSTVHTFSYIHGIERFSLFKQLSTFYLNPKGILYYWLEKKQLKSSAIVAVSETIRRDIRRYFPEADNIFTITPGVDLSAFKPIKKTHFIDKNEFKMGEAYNCELTVLFVGSEFRRKGLDNLILTLPEKTRLVIVGRGDHLSYYHHLVKAAGLQNKVTFKGLVDNIADYYASADVLVLPSLREAFGMAALEAMACGLPVVLSSATGVASLVEDGKNGFVFNQPSELKGILRRLSDPGIRKMIGENARLTAMNHTWDNAADQYEAIYWDIYDKKRKKKE